MKSQISGTVDALAKGAGRALGELTSRTHSLEEFGFKYLKNFIIFVSSLCWITVFSVWLY